MLLMWIQLEVGRPGKERWSNAHHQLLIFASSSVIRFVEKEVHGINMRVNSIKLKKIITGMILTCVCKGSNTPTWGLALNSLL